MNSNILGLRIASTLLGLVCLAQLTRLVKHIEVVIAGYTAPFWVSGVAFVVTGILSIWLWKISNNLRR
jgi:hypothetical protein